MKRNALTRDCLTFSIALSLFSAGATASTELPKPNSDQCDFYLELEKNLGCTTNSHDSSDYLTSYGYHYCRKFLKARGSWNESLKKWSSDTSKCLQEGLLRSPKRIEACSSMEERAFAMHPSCYKQTGFCTLSKEDRTLIFNLVGKSDLVRKFRKSVEQYLNVTLSCRFGAGEAITQVVRWLFRPVQSEKISAIHLGK